MMEIIKLIPGQVTITLYQTEVACLEWALAVAHNDGHVYWADHCLTHLGTFQALMLAMHALPVQTDELTVAAVLADAHQAADALDQFGKEHFERMMREQRRKGL